MYFYRALGNLTDKIYYYASNVDDEIPPVNCFPISETIRDFELIEEIPADQTTEVYFLDSSGGSVCKIAMPCINSDMLNKCAEGKLTEDDLCSPDMKEFIDNNLAASIHLVVDCLSNKWCQGGNE